MSGNIGCKTIIDNSLVLYLDASNTKSYPEYGENWNDLSKISFDVTLFNGTTFSYDNAGSISFDGVSEYGTIPYNSNFDLSITDYTIEGWFNSNTFSSGQVLISKDTNGVNYDWSLYVPDSTSLAFYSNATSTSVTASIPSLSTNQWYQYAITSVSGEIKIYLNSVLYGTGTMSTSNSSQVFVTVGCSSWNLPNGFMNGKISILRIYRRGLTANEILQNYNIVKTRFRL